MVENDPVPVRRQNAMQCMNMVLFYVKNLGELQWVQ